MTRSLLVAVGLAGAGWHPAARTAAPRRTLRPSWWRERAQRLERAGADLVTIDDALAPDPAGAARLDALLTASFLAPATARIGLAPTITTTHTEPFHVATGLQTLDFASRGRAAWQVAVSADDLTAAQFGRRTLPADPAERERELWQEAAEVIEVARRLWDSWEDDAIIRDRESGRFLDRDKLHYVDFEGERFSVKGPSITPRSPQGQPLVAVAATGDAALAVAAEHADLVFIAPSDGTLDRVRRAAAHRDGEPLRVIADVHAVLDADPRLARASIARLQRTASAPWADDAIVGTPDELLHVVDDLRSAGFDGVRLLPARSDADLDAIVAEVLPQLATAPSTLRERLGLGIPVNRYERVSA